MAIYDRLKSTAKIRRRKHERQPPHPPTANLLRRAKLILFISAWFFQSHDSLQNVLGANAEHPSDTTAKPTTNCPIQRDPSIGMQQGAIYVTLCLLGISCRNLSPVVLTSQFSENWAITTPVDKQREAPMPQRAALCIFSRLPIKKSDEAPFP